MYIHNIIMDHFKLYISLCFTCIEMSCHFARDCQDTVTFPALSIDQCCSVGSSISFTAAGGTCQPCISMW